MNHDITYQNARKFYISADTCAFSCCVHRW